MEHGKDTGGPNFTAEGTAGKCSTWHMMNDTQRFLDSTPACYLLVGLPSGSLNLFSLPGPLALKGQLILLHPPSLHPYEYLISGPTFIFYYPALRLNIMVRISHRHKGKSVSAPPSGRRSSGRLSPGRTVASTTRRRAISLRSLRSVQTQTISTSLRLLTWPPSAPVPSKKFPPTQIQCPSVETRGRSRLLNHCHRGPR